MIAVALLLAAAAVAAGALAWLVREITRADRQRIAEAWVALADVQRHIDEAREVHAEQRLASDAEWQAPTQQLYDQVEVEWLYEVYALPSPLDVWQEGDQPHRRGEL